MRTLLLVLAMLPFVVVPAPVGASHCDPSALPAHGTFEMSIDGKVYYLVETWGEWMPGPVRLYEETNGVYAAGAPVGANLQRDFMKGTEFVPEEWWPCVAYDVVPDTLHV